MTDITGALRDFARLFEQWDLPYAVMGGIAVRVYGIPRATYDVDFIVAVDRPRLPDLYRAIRDLGYTVPEQYEQGWVDRVAGMPVVKARLYLEGRGVDVDLFLAESRFQKEILARRRREQIDELAAWFVSPEDLILLKLISHRPRDVADIGDILFTQGQLDVAHMRKWAEELHVLDALDRALSEPPAT